MRYMTQNHESTKSSCLPGHEDTINKAQYIKLEIISKCKVIHVRFVLKLNLTNTTVKNNYISLICVLHILIIKIC